MNRLFYTLKKIFGSASVEPLGPEWQRMPVTCNALPDDQVPAVFWNSKKLGQFLLVHPDGENENISVPIKEGRARIKTVLHNDRKEILAIVVHIDLGGAEEQ